MRAKQMPYKALPHVLIIWESMSKKKGRDRRSFGVKYTKHVTMLKGVSEQVYVGYGSSVKLSDLQKQLVRTVKENGGIASTEVLLDALAKTRGATKIDSIEKLLYVNNSAQQILLRDKPGYWKLNPAFDQLDVGNSGPLTIEDTQNSRNRVKEEEEESSSVSGKQHRYKPYTPPPVSSRRKKEETKSTSDEEEDEEEEEEVIVEEEEESIEEEDEEEEEVKDEEDEDEPETKTVTVATNYTEPTVLQNFILEVIAKHGGNTSKETIDRYIAKHWNSILKKESSLADTNYKDAILCDLVSTVQKQSLFKFSDNHYSITKFGQSFVAVKERESVAETSKLTGMQDILMRILLQYGGVCSFDQIYEEYIKSNNGKGTDYKRISRALLASLSHNPPGNFKKTTDGNSWMIAPKAVAIAEQMIRENPKYSTDKLNV